MAFPAYQVVPVTIASGQTVSSAASVQGRDVVGIQLPGALTSTALTFQASYDGTTFQPVHASGSGSALSYTVAASRYYVVARGALGGMESLKLVGGSAEGADRVIQVILQPHTT